MSDRAFTAGVVPGGLTEQSHIKILICYILAHLEEPVSQEALLAAIADNGLANYFECAQAVSELLECKNLDESADKSYVLSKTGKQISDILSDDLPITVRERALESATYLIEHARRKKQHPVELVRREDGYLVRGKIVDGGAVLFSLEVYAPTYEAAALARERFIDKAESLMRLALNELFGESL
ncbi:MAG: DUF4364 family protein [Oscillospiraceae bacterium]